MKTPRITFFMLVTQRDLLIADYSIQSYKKINPEKLCYKLLIYANCLTNQQKQKYFKKWQKNQFVEIYDNEDKVKKSNFVKGELIYSPEGIARIRDEASENYDELWSTELKKLSTEFHATADADFEIIKPDFIYKMIEYLDQHQNTIAISTDYSPTQYNIYESYSNQAVNLWERWHTWFCIYRKEVFKCNTSHFFYVTNGENNLPTYFDSAAFFQKKLQENFGWELKCIDSKYQHQFIHYEAFSKNITISQKKIYLYRKLRIINKVGFCHFKCDFYPINKLDHYAKIIAKQIFNYFFLEADIERKKFN